MHYIINERILHTKFYNTLEYIFYLYIKYLVYFDIYYIYYDIDS